VLQAIIPSPVENLVTYASAFAAVAALGAAKKYTSLADTWLGKKLRPVQPWLVMAFSIAIPALIHGSAIPIDAGQLVAAPTATLLAVGAAEIFARIRR